MKKSLLLVVLFCFLAANTVLAQGKTAVIDMQAVTLQSKAGMKAVEKELLKNYRQKMQKLKSWQIVLINRKHHFLQQLFKIKTLN